MYSKRSPKRCKTDVGSYVVRRNRSRAGCPPCRTCLLTVAARREVAQLLRQQFKSFSASAASSCPNNLKGRTALSATTFVRVLSVVSQHLIHVPSIRLVPSPSIPKDLLIVNHPSTSFSIPGSMIIKYRATVRISGYENPSNFPSPRRSFPYRQQTG